MRTPITDFTDRPKAIQKLAKHFIERGGKYVCEISDRHILATLTAVTCTDGREENWATLTCTKGGNIRATIDELVRESVKQLDAWEARERT
jgi:hypothetical protein